MWTIPSKAYRIDPLLESLKHRYFVDTAQDEDKQLCLHSAELNATRKIAEEISQEIVTFSKTKDLSGNNLTDFIPKDKMQQNILVALNNVIVAGRYWEKRQYLKEKGAEKDYTVYKCDVVVKIEKGDLADTIIAYKTKAEKTLSEKDKETLDTVIESYVATLKSTN